MKHRKELLTELPPGSKVLFIRLRSLGDTILSTPLYAALKGWRPDLQIAALVEKPYDEVLLRNPDLRSVFCLPVNTATQRSSLAARWQTLGKIRRERFDCCINLHGGTTSAWLTWMSKARHRIGPIQFSQLLLLQPAAEIARAGARNPLAFYKVPIGMASPTWPAGRSPTALAFVSRSTSQAPTGGPAQGRRTLAIPTLLCDATQLPLPYQGVDPFRICRDLGLPAEPARLRNPAGWRRRRGVENQESRRPLPNPTRCDLGAFDL